MASNVKSSSAASFSRYTEMSIVGVRDVLNRWVAEVHSREDKQNRVTANNKILAFLRNGAQHELDLSALKLTSLPSVFSYGVFVERLKILDLSSNLLAEVPSEIFTLKNLEELDLSDNYNIDTIPDGIGNLIFLKKLVIFQDVQEYERIYGVDDFGDLEFPLSFGNLTQLEELTVSGYVMQDIPRVIYACSNLRRFTFTNANLPKIPLELCHRLSNLIELDVSCNFIEDVPAAISNLTQLKELNLSSNGIGFISDSIFTLSNACSINLEETELLEEQITAIKDRVDADGYTGPTFVLPRETLEQNDHEVPDVKRTRF